MKKTIKLVTVLALMLALIISCAPGPDAKPNNNGNGSDTTDGETSKIPAATMKDLETLMYFDQETGVPNFSTKVSMVTAEDAVKDAFRLQVIESLKSTELPLTGVTFEHKVENNTFKLTSSMITINTPAGNAYNILSLQQDGTTGNWIVITNVYETKEATKPTLITTTGLSGQILNKDKITGIELPTNDLASPCIFIEKTESENYTAMLYYKMTEEEFTKYCTETNKFEKDESNPLSYSFGDGKIYYGSADYHVEEGTMKCMMLTYIHLDPKEKH